MKMQTKVCPPLLSRCVYSRRWIGLKVACWIKRFPLCYFPYAKYSSRLHGSNRMGFALADSVSSTGRPMKPKQRLGEDWRGGRVKLIPANSGPDGINPICFYRMKITSVPLYLAATHFEKIGGRAALGGDLRGLFFPFLGLIPPAPLPSLTSLGRIQPFEGAPIYPSISKHILKWVSQRYHLHASVAGILWKRIQITTLA